MLRPLQKYAHPEMCAIRKAVCDSQELSWASEHLLLTEWALEIHGRYVIWKSLTDSRVHRALHFETSQVLDAKWVTFNDGQDHFCERIEPSLVVLVTSKLLTILASNGSQIDTFLPWDVNSIWPFCVHIVRSPKISTCHERPQGLILQRTSKPISELPCELVAIFQETWLPCTRLASLSHPLAAFKPIRTSLNIHNSPRKLDSITCDHIDGRVIFVSPQDADAAWVVMFNGFYHTFWLTSHNRGDRVPQRNERDVKNTSLASWWRGAYQGKAKCQSKFDLWHEPEIVLTRQHPHDAGVFRSRSPAKRVFMAVDSVGGLFLCLLISKCLIAVSTITLRIVFKIPGCLDAVPVETSVCAVDIILLKEGALHLVRGNVRIACICNDVTGLSTFYKPTVCHSHPRQTLHCIARDIRGLAEPVQSRISLIIDNGIAWRAEVVMRSLDKSTNDALDALHICLPVGQALAIRAATIQSAVYFDDDWRTFTLVIKYMISLQGISGASDESDPGYFSDVSRLERYPMTMVCDGKFQQTRSNSFSIPIPAIIVNTTRGVLLYCYGQTIPPLSLHATVHSLHLLYEDARLSTIAEDRAQALRQFLIELCQGDSSKDSLSCGARYLRGSSGFAQACECGFLSGDVFEWFSTVIVHGKPQFELQRLPAFLPNGDKAPGIHIRTIHKLFTCDMQSRSEAGSNLLIQESSATKVVLALVHSDIDLELLTFLPPAFSLPLYEAILRCRGAPPRDWSAEAYLFVGRRDLVMHSDMLSERFDCSLETRTIRTECGEYDSHHAQKRRDLHRLSLAAEMRSRNATLHYLHCDGRQECTYYSSHVSDDQGVGESFMMRRFGQFAPVSRVFHLLASSRPALLRMLQVPGTSDHEYRRIQHSKLLVACTRSCAAPPGRAMLTLGSLLLASCLEDRMDIPIISFTGIIMPSSTTITLDPAVSIPLNSWPSFHNGVASGLRLSSSRCNTAVQGPENWSVHSPCELRLSRAWILYNRPLVPSTEHGGLLLALGLQRFLNVLAMTDIYDYLTLGHDATTVGILLGMSAARCGSADVSVSKMLCLHIPALLPEPFTQMEVPSVAQVAAIAGIGLLYQSTGHRLMADFLLTEISRKTHSSHLRDGESYSLAAGLALGMVTVGFAVSMHYDTMTDLAIAPRLVHGMSRCTSPANAVACDKLLYTGACCEPSLATRGAC